jgi:hypothetical protein
MKKYQLLFLLAGTVVMMIVMSRTGTTLKTPLTPLGIVNLELANSAAKASETINVWASMRSVDNIRAAKVNTSFDFIFLFFYSLLLYFLCKELAQSMAGSFGYIGKLLAKGALIAGAFDVLENAGMLLSLNGHVNDVTTFFTFVFAVLKFTLVLASLGYVLIVAPIVLYRRYLLR